MKRAINATLGTSARLFGIGLEATYKQLNDVKYSNLSMTTILRCTITKSPSRYKQNPRLKSDIEKLMAEDISTFRRRYGTHFVAGYVEQSSISAVTHYTANTQEQLDNFKASMNVGKGILSADAAVDTLNSASNSNISKGVTWQSTGFNTLAPKPDLQPADIQNIFSYLVRSKPKALTAILHSYFLIAPSYEQLREAETIGPELRDAVIIALEGQRECRLYNFRSSDRLLESFIDVGLKFISTQPAKPTWRADLIKCNSQLEDNRIVQSYSSGNRGMNSWVGHTTTQRAICTGKLLNHSVSVSLLTFNRKDSNYPGKTPNFDFGYVSQDLAFYRMRYGKKLKFVGFMVRSMRNESG